MRTNYITKQTIALAVAIATGVGASAQGVAIGDKDFAPNAAAMLDVQSKNKGVLFPRVTYTERMYIQANAQSVGLLVYQTDKDAGYYYWDGLAWKFLSPQQTVELPTFAAVATTGSYSDLTNRPTLATVATTGDYNDLLNKPTIGGGGGGASGSSFSGSYNDLTDRPTIPTRLQDLTQDESYYTTVSRAEREYWNTKVDKADIPTKLQDLQQDENYYTTISKAERERWNATAEAGGFSGDYNDLTNKPRLGDLQQDENYYTTVSKTERDAWNAKSNFSGKYNDLEDKPAIPTHLKDLSTDEYYQTVSRGEKETWNSKVAQSDLNEFVTPTERANWNAAANATTAVTKTKLSDFDSNDDSKHYTVEEKTKLAGVAANAEVNVNADWTVTNGDAQILNKPTLGDLAAKDKISNVDIASDAAISLSKIDGQIVTYTSDENSNVTFNKDPSLKVSGGGNTTLGQSIEDFVIDNDKIKNAIIVAVKTAIEDKTSELYKKVILAALPIGSIIMWDNSTTPPCGWEIHAEFNGTKNQ